MSGFLGVPTGAAYHLVFALTQLLAPAAGGLAAVAAIVLFTAAVRLALSPLSLRALRGQAAMARLAPQVQALRARFGRQPERFSSELAALYKREGASPFAGFLPLLAQWPFLSVMYLLFRSATVDGAQNKLLSMSLFGVPLGGHWLSGAGLLSAHAANGRKAPSAGPAAAPARPDPAEALANSKAAALLTKVLPYLTVVIAAFAPPAAATSLVTRVAWPLAERRLFLRRPAPAPTPGTAAPGTAAPGTAAPGTATASAHGT